MMLPHPIPYQGSKRSLAVRIGSYVPRDMTTWYEPFAGSAAMSIWVAYHLRPKRIVIADSLLPMVDLWRAILDRPDYVARRYSEIWLGQTENAPDYFNDVRDRYNASGDPVDLLYLLCRCVKNAVRFNARGRFTQSVDKRRLGMRPGRMADAVRGASALLRGRTEVRAGDWLQTTDDARPNDFLYMDPPYLGTSEGRDKRYAEQMSQERLTAGLRVLRERKLRFALSYDGSSGGREYAPPLPPDLQLTRLQLRAGRSSQSTLNGGSAETIESLYLTPDLAASAHTGVWKRPVAVPTNRRFSQLDEVATVLARP